MEVDKYSGFEEKMHMTAEENLGDESPIEKPAIEEIIQLDSAECHYPFN